MIKKIVCLFSIILISVRLFCGDFYDTAVKTQLVRDLKTGCTPVKEAYPYGIIYLNHANDPYVLYKLLQICVDENLFNKSEKAQELISLYKQLNEIKDIFSLYKKINIKAPGFYVQNGYAYSETNFLSFHKLLQKMSLHEMDVFYDIGSGIGKLVLHAYLKSKARKCIGIEKVYAKHVIARKILDEASKKFNFSSNRIIDYVYGNLHYKDINDATVVYIGPNNFTQKSINEITQVLAKCKNLNKVYTLFELPEIYTLNLQKNMQASLKVETTHEGEKEVFCYVKK